MTQQQSLITMLPYFLVYSKVVQLYILSAVLCLVVQSCPTLCGPHALYVAHQVTLSMGILQARILEWVAMPSSIYIYLFFQILFLKQKKIYYELFISYLLVFLNSYSLISKQYQHALSLIPWQNFPLIMPRRKLKSTVGSPSL